MDKNRKKYWVRYISKFTRNYKISSFDNYEEAEWFRQQVNGEFLDWN